MPFTACSNVVVVVTAAVALLLLPAHYYMPKMVAREEPPAPPTPRYVEPPALTIKSAWRAIDHNLDDSPIFALDLLLAFVLFVSVGLIYLCEWIQRKIMERRLVKLNQHLSASVERLRARDAEKEHLQTTLRLAQNANAEYNLLLYLLLERQQQHRGLLSKEIIC